MLKSTGSPPYGLGLGARPFPPPSPPVLPGGDGDCSAYIIPGLDDVVAIIIDKIDPSAVRGSHLSDIPSWRTKFVDISAHDCDVVTITVTNGV